MTSTSFMVALVVVVITTVFAASLAFSFFFWRLRILERSVRGVPLDVTRPKTGLPLKVRLTLRDCGDGPQLRVVSCERWRADELHCAGECVCQLMVGERGQVKDEEAVLVAPGA